MTEMRREMRTTQSTPVPRMPDLRRSADLLSLAQDALRPIGIAPAAIRIACLQRCQTAGRVVAFLRGIRIGETDLTGAFEPGDVIEFPIRYLPWVDLPADIRFARESDGVEIASPFILRTPEDAIALVGLGDLQVEGLAIDQGVVRGIAVNRVNGLLKPNLYAKINGIVPRPVSVETPRLIDDGGASAAFSVRLEPADLCESGLTVEIHVMGAEAPLAAIAYRRADLDDVMKRVTSLEARLAQIGEATGYQFATLDREMNARMSAMQERIDTFIEYAASFLFDRLAASETAEVPGAPPRAAAVAEMQRDFLAMVRGAARVETPALSKAEALSLAGPEFGAGWQPVEARGAAEFRWMEAEGTVFNPSPDRAVDAVEIGIFAINGGRFPMLRCYFDNRPARLSRESAGEGGAILLIARPVEPAAAGNCGALRIESLLAPQPIEGGMEGRSGTIALSHLAFRYAEIS